MESGGLSRFGLVELDHGQLTAPHEVTSMSSGDALVFPRSTVAEITEPVTLACQHAILVHKHRYC